MSNHALIPLLLGLCTLALGFALPVAAVADARVSESHGKLPLHFEANQGQTHKDVRFLARGPGYGLYLTAGEALLVLTRPSPDENGKRNAQASPGPRAHGESVALHMALVGAARKPLVSGLDELSGKANYFIGKDPAKWRTNIPTYAKVHYREVYRGIDLLYYGNQRQLEYDFVVAPGADPKKIVLGFKGADRLEIDAEGDLVLHAAGGTIHQKKPVIYQEVDRVRHEIAGGYVRKGANRVGFKVAAYDRSRPLIIDPVVLSYSTYLGGSGNDYGSGIAVDADGNVYTTGLAASVNFPTTAGVFQPIFGGSGDVFVTKLDPAGSGLVYSTYLGGSGHEHGEKIAVDASGNAYVTGHTRSTDFPTMLGAFQSLAGGSDDVFVTKLNPTGSGLVYSTYLGGSGIDFGLGIAVDADGNVHVTGYTDSTNFPVTAGAFQLISGGGNDAFVTKLNPTGTGAVYSTYLGGSVQDYGRGIAVDTSSNAYAGGSTDSPLFPTTPGAYRSTFAGGWDDPFVTKLDPAGGVVYSTYLGGSNNDRASGIAVDASGNAYIVGSTWSLDFPTTAGAFQSIYGGGDYDGYVVKLDRTGSTLVYSTYLGGIDLDYGQGIAVDTRGNAYVTGNTYSINFPTTEGAFQRIFGGGSDAYVTQLNPTGSGLVYSTYLGGSAEDWGASIALDTLPSPNAYVAGYTSSTNFPTTNAYQSAYGGDPYDAFVAKIVDAAPPPPTTQPTPYTGTPIAVPGGFEAENFDLGGEGIAYHDNVRGNAGGQYRTSEDVDIIVSSDSAGGSYVVNNFETGEWLAYTISVQASAQYDIELRVSSAFANSAFHVEIDGMNVTGSVLVPNTGSWSTFQWVGKTGVSLATGQHVLKIVADQQYFNLNSIRITASATSAPFTGTPIAVPGSFEAEDFDRGGESVAYHDNVPGNAGGQYRTSEDVDIIVSSDTLGGGYVVNNFETGEWLAYTINVPTSGTYDIELRAATNWDFPNAAYHVEIDGVNATGSIVLPNTGGWSSFQWVGKTGVSLAAGQHVLKIVADQQYFNLNSIRITASPTSAPFTGTPIAVPGSFEAEDFDLGGEGVAYHDNVAGNTGGQYRPNEDVDIIASSDSAGGGYVVNNFETGEWLNYTINVQTATNYDIELRVSSSFSNSAFHVEIDGVNVTGSVLVPNTGSWSAFQWVGKKGITLTAGRHVLRIVTDEQYFNFNSVRVLPSTTRSEESAATYMGYWPSHGAETGTFSGGTIVASNQTAATATITFTGTAVSWIGTSKSTTGIARVYLDGAFVTEIDTYSATDGLQDTVFRVSDLAPGTDTLTIEATGRKNAAADSGLHRGGCFRRPPMT